MQLRHQATILAAATMLLSSASAWAEERAAASLLEGRWKVISAQSNGGNYMHDVIDKMTVHFDKDTVRFLIDGTDSEQAAKIVLRAGKQPAEIDFTREIKDHKWNNDNAVTKLFRAYKIVDQKGVPADDKREGIFKVEGRKLTLCWRIIPGHEQKADGKVSAESYLRPTNFRSDLYDHQFLFVLERFP